MRTGRLLVVTFELFQAGHRVKTFTPKTQATGLVAQMGTAALLTRCGWSHPWPELARIFSRVKFPSCPFLGGLQPSDSFHWIHGGLDDDILVVDTGDHGGVEDGVEQIGAWGWAMGEEKLLVQAANCVATLVQAGHLHWIWIWPRPSIS